MVLGNVLDKAIDYTAVRVGSLDYHITKSVYIHKSYAKVQTENYSGAVLAFPCVMLPHHSLYVTLNIRCESTYFKL